MFVKSVAMDLVLRFNINREYLKVGKRVEKAFKYRIYPNAEQEILIQKTFGCRRFVFNHYLAKRKETYEQSGETFNYYGFIRGEWQDLGDHIRSAITESIKQSKNWGKVDV